MNKQYRFFNYAVFFLAFLGLMAGYVILPSNDEIAYLNFKDKNFKDALKRYELQYEAGNRSPTLLGPLCDLYLQYGQVSKAIKILEDNLHILPDELETRKRLSTYYQYAQRPTDHMINLEAIARLQPGRKILRQLAQIYNYNEHFDKQVETLKLIIAKFGANHEDYISLAFLFAAQKRYPEAIDTINELLHEHFNQVTPQEIDFALSLMLDLGKKEEALALANRVISKKSKYLVRISDFFTLRGANDIAYSLMEPYESRTDLPAGILKALISVQLAQGKETQAYTRLTRRFQEKKLPVGLVTTFLSLILEKKDGKRLHQFISKGKVRYLGEAEILNIARSLLRLKQTEDALVLRRRLRTSFLAQHWIVSEVLRVMGQSGQRPDQVVQNQGRRLANWRRLYLARVYHELELYELAKAQLVEVTSLADIRYLDRADAVEVFIYYDMAPQAAAMLEKERKAVQNRPLVFQLPVMYSWMLVQISLHNEPVVDTWVASLTNPPADLFAQQYFMGVRFQRYPIALEGARTYREMEPSLQADEYYAQALVYNGLYPEALGILTQLYRRAPKEWLDPYAKALFASGKKEEWLALWNRELHKPDITKAQTTDIAFLYLSHGFKGEAEQVFLSQAAEEGPNGPALEQLLFLWGPRPSADRVTWLVAQTEAAEVSQKADWYGKLIQIGQGRRFVQYIRQHQPIETVALEDLYLSYLQYRPDTKAFITALSTAVENEDGELRLKRLSQMAGGQPLGEQAFKKLLAKIPQDKDSIAQLGVTAYQQGRFKDAFAYLEEALTMGANSPQVQFYYAELLRRNKNPKALVHYQTALDIVQASQKTDQGSQLIQAQIYWQLGQKQETVKIYRSLITQHPLEISLKADLANYLIEMGRLDEASELINVR